MFWFIFVENVNTKICNVKEGTEMVYFCLMFSVCFFFVDIVPSDCYLLLFCNSFFISYFCCHIFPHFCLHTYASQFFVHILVVTFITPSTHIFNLLVKFDYWRTRMAKSMLPSAQHNSQIVPKFWCPIQQNAPAKISEHNEKRNFSSIWQ